MISLAALMLRDLNKLTEFNHEFCSLIQITPASQSLNGWKNNNNINNSNVKVKVFVLALKNKMLVHKLHFFKFPQVIFVWYCLRKI